jgi:polar amino acid transport system substrate-binding protein
MIKLGLPLSVFLIPMIAGCIGPSIAPDPSPETRAELAPTGVLRVAVFTGNPVIGSKDKATGELGGTTVILGKALAQRVEVPVLLLEYIAVAKLVEDAKAGVWDIGVVAFDPARRNVLDFAPPHIAVDLTYLVPPGSAMHSVAEADQPGVRVAAARGAATALFLERTLRQATVAPAENEPAAFELLKDGRAQAYAQTRYKLLGLAEKLPGARVLDDRFSAAEMAIVMPKGRALALAYVENFIEEAKKSGLVAQAIETSGLRGVTVAPAAATAR